MKKILEHLKENWLGYGFETLVVIIGVLIAFSLADWNKKRSSNIEEIMSLKEMVNGFKKDKADIQFNVNVSNSIIKSSDIILQSFKSDMSYHDSLDTHFSGAFRKTRFNGNEGPYEVLKSKGLDLISNDTLRTQIINMYDLRFESIRNFESGFFISDEYIRQQLIKYFEIVELYELESRGRRPGRMKPHDFEALKKDKEFNTLLKTFRIQTLSYGVNYNNKVLGELETLIKSIETEIERLE